MRYPRGRRGAAILEFALAWPVTLLLALGCVELAVWGAESFAARSAALAGARAASVAGSSPRVAEVVTLRVLAPSLVGVQAAAWCPGQGWADRCPQSSRSGWETACRCTPMSRCRKRPSPRESRTVAGRARSLRTSRHPDDARRCRERAGHRRASGPRGGDAGGCCRSRSRPRSSERPECSHKPLPIHGRGLSAQFTALAHRARPVQQDG